MYQRTINQHNYNFRQYKRINLVSCLIYSRNSRPAEGISGLPGANTANTQTAEQCHVNPAYGEADQQHDYTYVMGREYPGPPTYLEIIDNVVFHDPEKAQGDTPAGDTPHYEILHKD